MQIRVYAKYTCICKIWSSYNRQCDVHNIHICIHIRYNFILKDSVIYSDAYKQAGRRDFTLFKIIKTIKKNSHEERNVCRNYSRSGNISNPFPILKQSCHQISSVFAVLSYISSGSLVSYLKLYLKMNQGLVCKKALAYTCLCEDQGHS